MDETAKKERENEAQLLDALRKGAEEGELFPCIGGKLAYSDIRMKLSHALHAIVVSNKRHLEVMKGFSGVGIAEEKPLEGAEEIVPQAGLFSNPAGVEVRYRGGKKRRMFVCRPGFMSLGFAAGSLVFGPFVARAAEAMRDKKSELSQRDAMIYLMMAAAGLHSDKAVQMKKIGSITSAAPLNALP